MRRGSVLRPSRRPSSSGERSVGKSLMQIRGIDYRGDAVQPIGCVAQAQAHRAAGEWKVHSCATQCNTVLLTAHLREDVHAHLLNEH